MNEIIEKYLNETHIPREKIRIESLISRCESPIEELFVTAFYSLDALEYLKTYLGVEVAYAIPQFSIGKYRVDFVIAICPRPHEQCLYVVELDGHEFHEKTKEQVKRNNQRDRYFLSEGITILHFSGSEVYNNPDACVKEVIECITGDDYIV